MAQHKVKRQLKLFQDKDLNPQKTLKNLNKNPSKKLLIINRGEIARRIIQSASERGFQVHLTVSGADRESLAARSADYCHEVDSYTNVDSILQLCLSLEPIFVHPGIGFLAESACFAALVEEHSGLTWVGPRSKSMSLLGDKISSKRLAESLGLKVLPWLEWESSDLPSLLEQKRIGLPCFLKFSGAGGGRALKKITTWETFSKAFQEVKSEAKAFDSTKGAIFLETQAPSARHIEIQILGDGQGGGLVLGDRDCSLQRRHQKLLEEAPAPGLDPSMRENLYKIAKQFLAATSYLSLGTLEFLLCGNEVFFLEMNPRLQVEHPVTEWVSALDLVGLQLDLAQGEALPQVSPKVFGAAIEVRLLAEGQGFLPSAGQIQKLKWPQGIGIRVDPGVEEGDLVSPIYDSLVAKLSVYASNRHLAFKRLEWALDNTQIQGKGLQTSLGYFRALIKSGTLVEKTIFTDFHFKGDWLQDSVLPQVQNLEQKESSSELTSSVAVLKKSLWARLACQDQSESSYDDVKDDDKSYENAKIVSVQDSHGFLLAPLSGIVRALLCQEGEMVKKGQTLAILESMKMEFPLESPIDGVLGTWKVSAGQLLAQGDCLLRVQKKL